MDSHLGNAQRLAAPIAVLAGGAVGVPILMLALVAAGALPGMMALVGVVMGLGWAAATLPALIRRLRG